MQRNLPLITAVFWHGRQRQFPWLDDDLIAGSVHPIELFEFFYTLRKNKWEGVWQLDQFPFREDPVAVANSAIGFLKGVERALDKLDFDAMRAAQERQDAVTALNLAREALFTSF